VKASGELKQLVTKGGIDDGGMRGRKTLRERKAKIWKRVGKVALQWVSFAGRGHYRKHNFFGKRGGAKI